MSSMHSTAHETGRSRRIALGVSTAFLTVMLLGSIAVRWMPQAPVMALSDGGTIEFLSIHRGVRIPPNDVKEHTPVDMDGCSWRHDFAPPTSWQQRAYALAPVSLQKHLPNAWRPERPSQAHSVGEHAMLWRVTSPSDMKEWRLTWVDANGVECEGHKDEPWGAGRKGLDLSDALPPCRSPDVLLRVRNAAGFKDSPIEDWPLIAELRMKNPFLLPPSPDPVDALPATRTQGGVTLTLQSIVVNPSAKKPHDRTKVKLVLPPQMNPKEWFGRVRVFDQRRTGISSFSTMSRAVSDGFTIETSQWLWSDSPWFVRVVLTPATGVKHPLCTEIQFKGIPLPNHASPVVPLKQSSGGFYATPSQFISGSKKGNGRLNLAFDRVKLADDAAFRIMEAIDNLGRRLEWESSDFSVGDLVNGDVCHELTLSGPDDLKATSVNVTVGFVTPLVFDFHVMPEFVSKMEHRESKKMPAAASR